MPTYLPPTLQRGALLLLKTNRHRQPDMLLLSAALAQHGGATILDGGNRFNAYQVAQAARLQTADLSILDRLQVARAFNCYQMLALCETAPPNTLPCLVIDLLDTFEDDNVPLRERLRLLHLALRGLARVQRQACVVVSIAPPKSDPGEWQQLARQVSRAATDTLKEGFMGKTIPTISQIVQESEVILARFSRVIQPEERHALEELFIKARKHIAAISEANHLLPFEVAQQAMLLEQEKEIIALKEQLAELKQWVAEFQNRP